MKSSGKITGNIRVDIGKEEHMAEFDTGKKLERLDSENACG